MGTPHCTELHSTVEILRATLQGNCLTWRGSLPCQAQLLPARLQKGATQSRLGAADWDPAQACWLCGRCRYPGTPRPGPASCGRRGA